MKKKKKIWILFVSYQAIYLPIQFGYNFSFLINHKFNMTQRDFLYPSYLDKAHRENPGSCSKYNIHMELI